MMEFLKKLGCVALACVMGATVLVGCGNNKEPGKLMGTGKETSEKKVDFGDGDNIIAKGDGIEISADTYGYYVYQCALTAAMKEDPNLTDVSNFDWEKVDQNGVKIADTIKENAVKAMIKKNITVDYGKKNGIKLTDEEIQQLKTGMDTYKTEQGDQMFNATLNSIGVSSVDKYMDLYESEMIYNKIKTDFNDNREKYIKDEKKMKEYKDDTNVSAQHILIKNNSTKYQDPRKTAEEVLKRVKSGEDFMALKEEFNEDTGEPKFGYSFGHGEMVPEFEDAAFKLDYDQTSEIVETNYGYHIIKRVVGLAEFENYLVAEAGVVENKELINKISLTDVLSKISDANKLLAEAKNGGKENAGE